MVESNFPYIYFYDSTYMGGTYLDGTYSDGTYINRRYDPVYISFSVWYLLPPDASYSRLDGYRYREPVRESVGYYYTSMEMPEQPGKYELRWLYQKDNSSFDEQYIQSFSVASDGIKPTPGYS